MRLWLKEKGYGEGKAPTLTDDIRYEVSARYTDAFERLTQRNRSGELPPVLELTPISSDILRESSMNTPLVPIIMGSESDLEHAKKIAGKLESSAWSMIYAWARRIKLPIICSKHEYESNGRPKVCYHCWTIERASGLIDAHVNSPVVACPPCNFGGADLYSSIRGLG